MATSTGTQLAQSIRQKMEELKRVCAGIEDATACLAPAGQWSPREILSHLLGPEGTGHLAALLPYLGDETPTIDLTPANPFYSDTRAKMHFVQLLAGVDKKYEDIANFAASLSAEQLDRTGHVPLFKESPFGEYPTLESLISVLGVYHVQGHIEQMQETLLAIAGM